MHATREPGPPSAPPPAAPRRRPDAGSVLVSLGFWLVFVTTSPLVFAVVLLIAALTAPFDRDRRLLHAFVGRALFGYLRLNPLWDVRVHGREHLPAGPCVIVPNHRSMADVPVCMGLRHPFKFVSKASLFALPVVGWTMRLLRYVRVERGRPHSMAEMLEACRAWLRRGVPVLIFPEGTYAPGPTLLPFRRGAFRLAIEEGVPVVPVAVEGTPSLVIEDGPWLSARCRVRVTVLPPLAPDSLGADDAALAEQVRARIAAALPGSEAEVPDLALAP